MKYQIRVRVNSRLAGVVLALLLLACALSTVMSACTLSRDTSDKSPSSGVTTTMRATSPEVIEGTIDVYRVQVRPSLIIFWGTAGLPDGTVLHSQLYEMDSPLAWWPESTDIIVENGGWTISVALDEPGEVRNILVGPRYYYEAWEKDNPVDSDGLYFDLVGPPAPEPYWHRWAFWLLVGIIALAIAIAAGVYGIIRLRRR